MPALAITQEHNDDRAVGRSSRSEPSGRRACGGINLTVLGLEIRRLLRNRRTVIFALIFPVVLFAFVGTNKSYANLPDGHGNVSAFLVVSMALYGAALATTAGGAMVSIERAQGWSRQLRLTPLSPVAYVIVKTLTAMVLGLSSVLAVFVVGQADRRAAHVPGLRLPVVRLRGLRLDRLAGIRGARPVHRLPAAVRERHAVPGPGDGGARLRRRACSTRSSRPRRYCRTSPSGRRCTA